MSDPPLSTMAASTAATPSRANQTARTAPTDTPTPAATKSLVKRDFDLVIRAFFPVPTAPAKFNPTSAMQQLLRVMIKDEPSLVLRTPTNDQQIVLETMPLPTGEKAFKKYCTVSTPRSERQNQNHVCIGCHLLSNRSLGNIKFQSNENHLLAWLKKAKVFIESDSLGVERPVTVGYFTKLDPTLTHLANFRDNLVNQLMLVEIDAETAVTLAPHLKKDQLEAMSNGDDYVPILPHFEVYKTRLSHGNASSSIKTEVIGVKGAPQDAKLLGEFLMRLASETDHDQRDGVFIAKGAAQMLGSPVYEQILKDNNFFINNLATIPINLEYDAWFAPIEATQQSEAEPVSLYEHLLRHPWFLRVESVGRKKCIIITNRSTLPEARKWIDENLQRLILKSLPPGTDPPESSLPRRLDKPVITATSQTYADILKKQFNLAPTRNDTTPTNAPTRPARKRQATLIDYDSDNSADYPPLSVNQVDRTSNNNANSNNNLPPSSSTSNLSSIDMKYATELQSLKNEIQTLRTLLTNTVDQIKSEIASVFASIPVKPSTSNTETLTSSNMETEVESPTTTDLSDLIAGLKHDIATKLDISDLIIDLKSDIALIKSHPLFCNLRPINQQHPVT